MRPIAWVSLVAMCGIILCGLCIVFGLYILPRPSSYDSLSVPRQEEEDILNIEINRPGSYGSLSAPRPPRTAKANSKKIDPVWIVPSAWMANRQEALEDALEKAQGEVVKYLRSRQPALIWTPPIDYIQDHLMKDMPRDESGFQDEIADTAQSHVRAGLHDVQQEERKFGGIGTMRRVCIKVAITPRDYESLYREDAQYRAQLRQELAQQRQGWLARGLTLFVALLTAIAGYFRLEDVTKGYYTHWLRLAAVMLVALVGAGVWVLW